MLTIALDLYFTLFDQLNLPYCLGLLIKDCLRLLMKDKQLDNERNKLELKMISQNRLDQQQSNDKFEMEIENTLLRAEVRNLQKLNGFLKLKINLLEDQKPPSQVTLINKQLYLEYMEEVLVYKQKQLIQAEKRNQVRSLQLINEQSYIKLLNPLQNSTDIDIFLKKIQQIKALVLTYESQNSSFEVQQWKEFMKKQAQIVEMCRNYQRQTQNMIKTEYQNLIRQRKHIAQSMDKFQQLHSYEKYLNQLQHVLEDKEQQLEAKQQQLLAKYQQVANSQQQYAQSQQLSGAPNCISFARENYSMKQPAQKRRLKIFQSANKSQDHKFFQQYQSSNSSNNHPFSHISQPPYSNHISQPTPKDQSSFIMQEAESKKNQTLRQCQKCLARQFQTPPIKPTQSVSLQTVIEFPNETLQRLQKEQKLLKFAQLWLKFSIDTKKPTSNSSKKTIAFYLWKLNTLMDPHIPDHLKTNYHWPLKYQQSLKDQQLFPYAQLSLNRKKYAELSLNYQLKILHQSKIKNALKNIIKNKNFKERLIYFCYFKKYAEHAKLKTINQWEKAVTNANKMSGKDTTVMEPHSRYHTESNLVSVHSSRIMNEYRPLQQSNQGYKEHRKSKGTLNGKSMSSTNILNFSQQKNKNGKENISSTQSLDPKKLKEYIRNHEQAQKMLASQCVKTQGVCRMGQTLMGCVNRSMIGGFYMIRGRQENERIMELQRRINKYEFKWELFMTKCKLALVNNNNKISHLEETLGFMFTK